MILTRITSLILFIFIILLGILGKFKLFIKKKERDFDVKKSDNKSTLILPYHNYFNSNLLGILKDMNFNGEVILIDCNSDDDSSGKWKNLQQNFFFENFNVQLFFSSYIDIDRSIELSLSISSYSHLIIFPLYQNVDLEYIEKLINKYFNACKCLQVIGYNNSYNKLNSYCRIFYKLLIKNSDSTKDLLSLINSQCSNNEIEFIKFNTFVWDYKSSKTPLNLNINYKIFDGIKHIGLILDGNRRFCKKRGTSKKTQHLVGLLKMMELIHFFRYTSVKYLTLYTFAEANWKRSEEEINQIIKLLFFIKNEYLKKNSVFNNIKIKISSTDTSNFNSELKDCIKQINNYSKSKKGEELYVNILFSYSAQNEIINAMNKCKKMTKENFEKNLVTFDFPELDFIIRTGGDYRLSDFLLYQSAYSEFFFLEKKFPELSFHDIINICNQYHSRKKNYGK